MSKVLEQKLREKSAPEAGDAAKIVALVNQAIDKTRELSHGLMPVLSDARGLMDALESMVFQAEDLFKVPCAFECDQPVLIRQNDVATHLYHIAQEAVNNALKHGQPRHIVVRLAGGERPFLSVEDDGVGLNKSRVPGGHRQGMGLLIMTYRAKMIGGALEVGRALAGGTLVCCTFSVSSLG